MAANILHKHLSASLYFTSFCFIFKFLIDYSLNMLTDPDLIEKLESKISYLEYNLENLSNEVYELRQIIEKQKIQINFLAGKLKSVEVSNIAPRSEETPPPHY